MDTHAPVMKQIMPHVMSRIFNKSVAEIKSEEPQSILGANLVELCGDMLTVKSEPVRILPAMNNAPRGSELRGHSFYEAASLRKFGGLYYFIYSSHVNHELCYATSRFPDRDYTYRGVIISNGDIGLDGRKPKDRLCATGTNHGSIDRINGQHYIFYHRLTHNTAFSRQGCAEPITIEPDGTIRQVEMTICGLNGGPLTARGTYPAAICCNLTNGHMPHLSNAKKNKYAPNINHEGNTRFVKDIEPGALLGYKYFSFQGTMQIRVTSRGHGGTLAVMTEPGKPLAELRLHEAKGWKTSDTATFRAHGKLPLYLCWHGKGSIDLLDFTLTEGDV